MIAGFIEITKILHEKFGNIEVVCNLLCLFGFVMVLIIIHIFKVDVKKTWKRILKKLLLLVLFDH